MAKCDYCGSRILFGGVKQQGLTFCNEKCHQQGFLVEIAEKAPPDIIAERLKNVQLSPCPYCGGPGPIDVHTSYLVYSILVMTSWNSRPRVCCRRCGVKSKLGGAALSGVFGWWGLPWGLILTPIMVGRNVVGLFHRPTLGKPSKQLATMVKMQLGAELIEASKARQSE